LLLAVSAVIGLVLPLALVARLRVVLLALLVLLEQRLALLEQRLPVLPVLLLEQAPLPPLRTLCRRLAYRLHRALAVLPLISVQRF
jgi:hypothetical protein